MRINALVVLSCFSLLFQNCSGFNTTETSTQNSASQCFSSVKSAMDNMGVENLDCESASVYQCQERVFSPKVANQELSRRECVALKTDAPSVCVSVAETDINTSAARQNDQVDERAFAEGGNYNYVDVNCQHNLVVLGLSAFRGQGDSVAVALSAARNECLKAKGQL